MDPFATSELWFKPQLRVLSTEQIRTLHQSTLEVLEGIGFQLTHPEALEILHGAGARIEGNRVRLPSHLVEWALHTAPSKVVLTDRSGARKVTLEGDKSWFGPSLDCVDYLDPMTDERSRFTSSHCQITASLADALDAYSWVMTIGMADDVDPDFADRAIAMEVFKHCEKPLVFCCNDLNSLKAIHEMALLFRRDRDHLLQAPNIVHYSEPISPLLYYDPAVEKILYCAREGIPLINYPAPQAGSTSPATLAGTLVQASAESLSGLVLVQLVRKGAPFIYGGFATVMDMSTTVFSYGAPEMSLMAAAMAQIAQHYRLPFFGTAGCSDAKLPDPQSAAEAAFSCLSSALSGANLVHDSGWLDHGSLASPAYMVLVHEVLGMVRHFMKGIPVSNDTLALEVIEEVGPGAHFLYSDHTYQHFRDIWYSELFDRSIYDVWVEGGRQTFQQRLREITRRRMEHQPEPLLPEVEGELDAMKATWN